MDMRAHSTMEHSSWSAKTYTGLKLFGFCSQLLCSCWRWAVIFFCSCSSSGSQRRHSMTSWGILGPGLMTHLEYESWGLMRIPAAKSCESTQPLLRCDLMVQLEEVHWYWLRPGEPDDQNQDIDEGWSVCKMVTEWMFSVKVKSFWWVEVRAGLLSSLNLPACIKAFLCCLRARSRLYMGPNLFLPPLIRSARTAVRKSSSVRGRCDWHLSS